MTQLTTIAPSRAARRRCPPGDHTVELSDRTKIAERLLESSRRHSFDPDVEVDWDAPPERDKFYLPPQTLTLYETYLWDRLSDAERVEFSKHELASTAYLGIWFEVILLQAVSRHVYWQDLTSQHVRYALTELADECRHSKMFGRMITTFGAPIYPPSPATNLQGWLLKSVEPSLGSFAAILIVEEILDAVQRVTFPDERIQPIVRQVTRIHVIEEARHVTFAREELKRQMAGITPAHRALARMLVARVLQVVVNSLIQPKVYAAVGIDPREGAAVARRSPHRHATTYWTTRRLRAFFDELGLIGGPSAAVWRSIGAL